MTIRQHPNGPSPLVPLVVLLRDVVEARARFAQERRQPATPPGSADAARRQMLAALKAYTAALEARGLPVPYALRDELRIHQRACR